MALDLKKGKGSADYLKKGVKKEEVTAISPVPQKGTDVFSSDKTDDSSKKKPWWLFVVVLLGVVSVLFFLFKDGDNQKENPVAERVNVSENIASQNVAVPQNGENKTSDNAGSADKNAEAQGEKNNDTEQPEKSSSSENTGNDQNVKKEERIEKEEKVEKYADRSIQSEKIANNVAERDETINYSRDEARKVTIYFDFNSSELKEDEKSKLANITSISALRSVLITGYTCNMGDDEYNKDLSIARAHSVREYLKQTFDGKTKLVIKGAGSENPVADNDTKDGRYKNRRVEVSY